MTVELRHLRAFLAIAEEGSDDRCAGLARGRVDVALLRAFAADCAARTELLRTGTRVAAIAAGRAVGVTTTATARAHRHHSVAYVPLTGVPAVPLVLAWRDPPGHPAVPALLTLAHQVVGEAAQEPTGPGSR